MKNLFSLFILILTGTASNAQLTVNVYHTEDASLNAKDVIYYNPGDFLVWGDFKGTPDIPGNVAAITTSGFGYKMNMRTGGGGGTINVGVYCYFSKSKSWVKPGKNTAYILNHEQHHFDVSYLASEIFISRVKAAGLNAQNCNVLLPKIYKECCDLMNDMQNKYDGQTANGQIEEMQQKWNAFFDKQLGTVSL